MLVQLSVAVASRERDREGELEVSGCSPEVLCLDLLSRLSSLTLEPFLSAAVPRGTGAPQCRRGQLALASGCWRGWVGRRGSASKESKAAR